MGSLVQFVCFTTALPQDEFLQSWEPFASAFLARGIHRIVLSENVARSGEPGFDYVSRNLWDESRFERAFPHGVRGSGGLGAIGVLQAGAFRLVDPPTFDLQAGPRSDSKLMVFLMTRAGQRERTRAAIRAALQDPAITGCAFYLKDGDARTDRFDMVVEVFGRDDGACEDAVAPLRAAVAPFVTAAAVIVSTFHEVAELGVEARKD
ncbi:MAG: hypothetical protein IT355_00440 [Gemmatimonadaceae bacterium]|nr:hypothetical protein [Gemmatimonadaceae bacterium]